MRLTLCERGPRLTFARCYGGGFVCVSLDWLFLLGCLRPWASEDGCDWNGGDWDDCVGVGGGLLFRSPYATR